jgi:hypothetical protein
MTDLTPLMLLKAVLIVLPSLAYLGLTWLVWRGRLFGAKGRSRFGAVSMFLVVAIGCVLLGGVVGGAIYDTGPGRGCRELGCLAVIGWIVGGALVGLPVGVVGGVLLRKLPGRHVVAFYVPALLLLLASIALVTFNSDMLR